MKDENGVPITIEVPVYYAIDDDGILIDREEMIDEFLAIVGKLEDKHNTIDN